VTRQANVLEPVMPQQEPFLSIGLMYLLPGVPGTLPALFEARG
jgi:hypothetical protein